MTALDLIAESARLGITLAVKGDRILCRPKARMTPALRAGLKAHKVDVMDLLDERERWPDGRPWWVDGIMDGPVARDVGTIGYREHLARIRGYAAEGVKTEAVGSSLLDATKATRPTGGPNRVVDAASTAEKIQTESPCPPAVYGVDCI